MLYSTPNSGSSCVGTEIAIYNGLIRIAYCKTVSISFPYVTHDITTSTGQICKRHWRWKGSICNLSRTMSIVYHCATIYPLYADSAEVYTRFYSDITYSVYCDGFTSLRCDKSQLCGKTTGHGWSWNATELGCGMPPCSYKHQLTLWPCGTLTIVTILHHYNSSKCFNIQFSVYVMPKHVCHPA